MRAQAPAHEVPLDHVDLEALDSFLMSDRSPPESMMLRRGTSRYSGTIKWRIRTGYQVIGSLGAHARDRPPSGFAHFGGSCG